MEDFDIESKFNKKYGVITRKILRMLSDDSRISITKMAKKLNLSRRTVTLRLKKIEGAFNVNYTLDLDEAKLGFENPHLILVKFLKKADHRAIKEAICDSYIVQFAATVKGSYDLIVYASAHSALEYMNWDRGLRSKFLSKYRAYWDPSEVSFKRFGYFPMRNEAIDKSNIPTKYKEMLKILNKNSRISFNELSDLLKMNYKTTVYNFNNLVKSGYIKSFTIAMNLHQDISPITMFSKYIPPENNEEAIRLTKRLLTTDDPEPLVSRYILTASLVGSYDFFTVGIFDDFKTGYKYGIQYYRHLFRKYPPLKLEYGEIKEILVGKLPIRSIDPTTGFDSIPKIG